MGRSACLRCGFPSAAASCLATIGEPLRSCQQAFSNCHLPEAQQLQQAVLGHLEYCDNYLMILIDSTKVTHSMKFGSRPAVCILIRTAPSGTPSLSILKNGSNRGSFLMVSTFSTGGGGGGAPSLDMNGGGLDAFIDTSSRKLRKL